MTDTAVFGPIISGTAVERAVLATIRRWESTYLRWIERVEGRPVGDLPAARNIAIRRELEKWPEDQLPYVVIVAPGLIDAPDEDTDAYHVRYDVRVVCVVSATTEAETWERADLRAQALIALLVKHGELGGLARATDWLDYSRDDLPADGDRSLGVGAARFSVDVPSVLDLAHRPDVPTDTPPPDGPEASSVTVTADRRSNL